MSTAAHPTTPLPSLAAPPAARSLALSVAAHLALTLVAALALPRLSSLRVARTVPAVEFVIEAAPAPPPPAPAPSPSVDEAPAPPAPAAAPPAPVARRAVAAPRVARPSLPPAVVEPPPRATPPSPSPPAPSPPAPSPPALSAADILRGASRAVPAFAATSPLTATDTRGESRDVFGGGGARGEGDARVREAASSTIVEASREGRPDAPGVRSYLWGVRRRVIEMWRPGVVRVPNLAETLMSSFVSPERALRMFGQRFMERQREAVEMSERVAGASDAIEAIGGVAGRGPDQRHAPRDAFNESWRRNVRITRAEVEVEQTETGAVRAVRVVRSSNIGGFDRAAVEAVRAALDELDPVPLPGGRRSRWSFTVLATRNLITPNVGGEFDESRGWFSIQLPGQVRLRSRVRMESSAALEAN